MWDLLWESVVEKVTFDQRLKRGGSQLCGYLGESVFQAEGKSLQRPSGEKRPGLLKTSRGEEGDR